MAKREPKMALTTLAHHIDVEFLREAYRRTRKNGAAGIDGQTAKEYAEDLENNLESLLNRFKSGTYRAPAVRRVYIPKGDGKSQRPLGIPTFEDKVLQRAVTMVLEAVYEEDFLHCSYGFRPKRSAHQALQVARDGIMEMKGGFVLELDIQKFYDTLDHGQLRQILNQRIHDGVLRRMIDKWLKAGIFEDGQLRRSIEGTPQGGVVSPVLSNIYLHEVLDKWFELEVKPRMKGEAFLTRYADDAVIVFEREEDAQRVMAVLPKRFERYGLTLHPEKTKLIPFRRPWRKPSKSRKRGTEESFDLLGFTHYWAASRKGNWVIKQKTAKSRFRRALKGITEWCEKHRHMPVVKQHSMLKQKLLGHYGYYGITGNSNALMRFAQGTAEIWRKWLDRRSQHRHMPWERFKRLLKRYPLPSPICIHSLYRRVANP